MDGKKEYFLSSSDEIASQYCQKDLPENCTVWLYKLTNEDGMDAGHPLVFTATKYSQKPFEKYI